MFSLSYPQTTIVASEAAPSAPPVLPPAQTLSEWGLLGTIVFLTFQKGWEVFSKKEDAESALVKQLIDGLRENQSQMLGQMVRTAERSHDDIKELKDAILQMTNITRQELEEVRTGLEDAIEKQQTAIAEQSAAIVKQQETIAELRLYLSQIRRDLVNHSSK